MWTCGRRRASRVDRRDHGALTSCPQCGEEIGPGQEYCLECGLRVLGPGALGRPSETGRGWVLRALVGLLVALVGAAAAVAATGGTAGNTALLTATGGFASTPASDTIPLPSSNSQAGIIDWPTGQDGWTIALATLPQSDGRQAAMTRARASTQGWASVRRSPRLVALRKSPSGVLAGFYGRLHLGGRGNERTPGRSELRPIRGSSAHRPVSSSCQL